MTKRLTASLIPYSSIVGGGILLQDANGAVVGQLALLGSTGVAEMLETPEQKAAFRDDYVELCTYIAEAINAGQPAGKVRHKNGGTYEVLPKPALFQVSNDDRHLAHQGLHKARIVHDQTEVTIYRREVNGEPMHFVRFPDEMVSPRFETVE